MKNINLKKKFKETIFENSQLKNLLIGNLSDPNKPQQTPNINYSIVKPTPLINPRLLCLSKLCCLFLGYDYNQLLEDKELPYYLSGNILISESTPIAHCYCGHQFGVFAGQLGDGRAITLGDLYDIDNRELWEIQLKGSGVTPYSRFADGRAVLRSSIREFLCSEHLWALGIPTTRALSIVGSESKVERDPLYNGRIIKEECCTVTRIAPTFFRFGSFEIFKDYDKLSGNKGPSVGMEINMLPIMLDYIAEYHFNELWKKFKGKELYIEMFKIIVIRTAVLAAYWQSYGFCHGVLNTDNMSILGLTIDFGPYGFLEYFDPGFICNHSDKNGRYCYNQQPYICKWNLLKLSEAWNHCLNMEESQKIINDYYEKTFENYYIHVNCQKLGINYMKTDKDLIDELYNLLNDFGFDLTLIFRKLCDIDKSNESKNVFVESMIKYSLPMNLLMEKKKPNISNQNLGILLDLKSKSPISLYTFYGIDPDYVDYQYMKSEKIKSFVDKKYNQESYEYDKKERLNKWVDKYQDRLNIEFLERNNDYSYLNDLEYIYEFPLSPYAHNNLIQKRLDYSVYSEDDFYKIKKTNMKKINPKFILRNHVVQKVIESAEKGNYEYLYNVLKIMTSPFDEHDDEEFENKYDTNIKLAYNICVSCSS